VAALHWPVRCVSLGGRGRPFQPRQFSCKMTTAGAPGQTRKLRRLVFPDRSVRSGRRFLDHRLTGPRRRRVDTRHRESSTRGEPPVSDPTGRSARVVRVVELHATGQPQHEEDDQHQAENATEPRSAVAIIALVAAPAAYEEVRLSCVWGTLWWRQRGGGSSRGSDCRSHRVE
jgi:hypothetical protein